ncbi:MAG: hypothetical protein ACI9CO_000324 [Candidatus Azotimanducaceae bacterium]|jgi:hypothetical protein
MKLVGKLNCALTSLKYEDLNPMGLCIIIAQAKDNNSQTEQTVIIKADSKVIELSPVELIELTFGYLIVTKNGIINTLSEMIKGVKNRSAV